MCFSCLPYWKQNLPLSRYERYDEIDIVINMMFCLLIWQYPAQLLVTLFHSITYVRNFSLPCYKNGMSLKRFIQLMGKLVYYIIYASTFIFLSTPVSAYYKVSFTQYCTHVFFPKFCADGNTFLCSLKENRCRGRN